MKLTKPLLNSPAFLASVCLLVAMDVGRGQDLTRLVNPFMGVRGRGNTVIGPQLPWGSVNPSPDTASGNSDGYNPDKPIRGFSQLHVTGTGSCGKYGQFLISPQIGLNIKEDGHDSEKADELAQIFAYKVRLKKYDILCELSPTAHAALYRFTFPKSDESHILIDLGYNLPQSLSGAGYMDAGEVSVDAPHQTITGWGDYWGGWSAEPVRLYFAAQYNTPGTGFGTWKNDDTANSVSHQEVTHRRQRIGGYVGFKTEAGQQVLMKIAVSFSSLEKAEQFLKQEIPEWDLTKVEADARNAWSQKLSQIQIEGASQQQESIFYTTLYNTMRMPKTERATTRTGIPARLIGMTIIAYGICGGPFSRWMFCFTRAWCATISMPSSIASNRTVSFRTLSSVGMTVTTNGPARIVTNGLVIKVETTWATSWRTRSSKASKVSIGDQHTSCSRARRTKTGRRPIGHRTAAGCRIGSMPSASIVRALWSFATTTIVHPKWPRLWVMPAIPTDI